MNRITTKSKGADFASLLEAVNTADDGPLAANLDTFSNELKFCVLGRRICLALETVLADLCNLGSNDTLAILFNRQDLLGNSTERLACTALLSIAATHEGLMAGMHAQSLLLGLVLFSTASAESKAADNQALTRRARQWVAECLFQLLQSETFLSQNGCRSAFESLLGVRIAELQQRRLSKQDTTSLLAGRLQSTVKASGLKQAIGTWLKQRESMQKCNPSEVGHSTVFVTAAAADVLLSLRMAHVRAVCGELAALVEFCVAHKRPLDADVRLFTLAFTHYCCDLLKHRVPDFGQDDTCSRDVVAFLDRIASLQAIFSELPDPLRHAIFEEFPAAFDREVVNCVAALSEDAKLGDEVVAAAITRFFPGEAKQQLQQQQQPFVKFECKHCDAIAAQTPLTLPASSIALVLMATEQLETLLPRPQQQGMKPAAVTALLSAVTQLLVRTCREEPSPMSSNASIANWFPASCREMVLTLLERPSLAGIERLLRLRVKVAQPESAMQSCAMLDDVQPVKQGTDSGNAAETMDTAADSSIPAPAAETKSDRVMQIGSKQMEASEANNTAATAKTEQKEVSAAESTQPSLATEQWLTLCKFAAWPAFARAAVQSEQSNSGAAAMTDSVHRDETTVAVEFIAWAEHRP